MPNHTHNTKQLENIENSLFSLSSNIVEDKYHIARIIQVCSSFSILDIEEETNDHNRLDSIYAVIGELIEKEIIKDTGDFALTPNNYYKIYRIADGKKDELDQYVEILNQGRIQPDRQGKPRGFNFRVAESLVKQLTQNSDSLGEDEKISILDSLKKKLALAQLEATPEKISNLDQRNISEAHLRKLYAEYLLAQQQWSSSIIQLLISGRTFSQYSLWDEHSIVESHACNILIEEYQRIKEETSISSTPKLLDFAKQLDKLIGKATNLKCNSPVLKFTAKNILKEIEYYIEYLTRESHELIKIINGGWTISAREDDPLISPIYYFLNEARLSMMNYDNKEAKAILEKAQNSLQENLYKIDPQEIKTIETYLNKHLGILQHLLLLSEENQTNLAIDNLNFRNILPFYLFDVVDKLVSLTSKNQELVRQSKKEIADKSPKPKESIQNDGERNIRQSSFGDLPDQDYSPTDLQKFSYSSGKHPLELQRSIRPDNNSSSSSLIYTKRRDNDTERYTQSIESRDLFPFNKDEENIEGNFRISPDEILVKTYDENFLLPSPDERINRKKLTKETYNLSRPSYRRLDKLDQVGVNSHAK